MGTIGIILLVAFVIICLLLVLLILVQNEDGGMGGLLSGAGTAAFGSHSAGVLTKATFVLVILFFLTSFGLALINKKPAAVKDLSAAATVEQQTAGNAESQSEWWKDSDSANQTSSPEASTK
jgi:preprotein translocase subunit SecG